MKSYKQIIKTIAILVIPYLPFLFFAILNYWSRPYVAQDGYSTVYYNQNFYALLRKIEILWSVAIGAFTALWVILIIHTKKRSTVFIIIAHLCIATAMIYYVFLPSDINNQDTAITFSLILQQGTTNLLNNWGMFILTLVYLFLNRSHFPHAKESSIDDALSSTSASVRQDPQPQSIEKELVLPKEAKKTLIKSTPLSSKQLFKEESNEEWMPKRQDHGDHNEA